MEYCLVPNYVLDFKDFLYIFFEDRNATSIVLRPKYQKFTDQLLNTAFHSVFRELNTILLLNTK